MVFWKHYHLFYAHIAQSRALSLLRGTNANFVVGESPVMGDIIAAMYVLLYLKTFA